MKLESLVQYMDGYLGVAGFPDYPSALNGLQVGSGPDHDVKRICASVDASEAVIEDAVERGASLLIVHHGLFWEGLRPLVDRRFRKVRRLVKGGLALYSVHLPLDAHAEVGNCALLAAQLGVEPRGRFGSYETVEIGWWGEAAPLDREAFSGRVAEAVGGPVRLIPGGPPTLGRVAVLTGAGGSFIEEAARRGLDSLVTGEGSHHTFMDAMELGVNVFYAGHYATETLGVQALAAHVAERFDLEWTFLDHPTGL